MKKRKKFTSTQIWKQLNDMLNFMGQLSINDKNAVQEICLIEFIQKISICIDLAAYSYKDEILQNKLKYAKLCKENFMGIATSLTYLYNSRAFNQHQYVSILKIFNECLLNLNRWIKSLEQSNE